LGNVYIGDEYNYRIRKVNAAGIITTIAGIGTFGYSGDGGPATAASIFNIPAIARHGIGNIYISDNGNDRVRMLSTITYFVNGSLQSTNVCPGTVSIDTLLAANDTNSGAAETWSLIYGPFHGSVSASYSGYSTGGIFMPSGTTYTALPGYTGADTFTVRITDGIISDTTTVYVHVRAAADAGTITGADSVCEGNSITLANTAAGGVWSSSSGHVSVSAGVVTGISAGTAIISYTVSNVCGPVSALDTIDIKRCNTKVNSVPSGNGHMMIRPNPNNGTFSFILGSSTTSEVRLSVTDVTGRKILETTSQTNKPTILHLDAPPGVYFLNATTADGVWSGKVVVGK
jgi:hypothetical protein